MADHGPTDSKRVRAEQLLVFAAGGGGCGGPGCGAGRGGPVQGSGRGGWGRGVVMVMVVVLK